MKLKLKNIGKIREAEIDIEGITVIAGENNTGKSTVGKTLYALCEAFHDTDDKIRNLQVESIINILQKKYHTHLPLNGIVRIVQGKIRELQENKLVRRAFFKDLIKLIGPSQGPVDENGFALLDEDTFKKIEERLQFKNELLVPEIVARALYAEFEDQTRCVLNHDMGEITFFKDDASIKAEIGKVRKFENQGFVHLDNCSLRTDKAIYIDNTFGLVRFDGTVSHQYALEMTLRTSSEDVNLIDSLMTRKALSLIWEKVNKVCEGVLFEDQYGDWRYRAKNTDSSFPLKNVSTGILAFAILKRLIENGSLQENGILILDEPETHLHPEWQINFAEVIVLLRQEFNFKILINTHSYHFLHALEVFSRLHKIEDQCRFYLAEADGDMAVIEDVTGYTDKIYEKLWKPVKKLKEIEAKLDGEDTGYEDE